MDRSTAEAKMTIPHPVAYETSQLWTLLNAGPKWKWLFYRTTWVNLILYPLCTLESNRGPDPLTREHRRFRQWAKLKVKYFQWLLMWFRVELCPPPSCHWSFRIFCCQDGWEQLVFSDSTLETSQHIWVMFTYGKCAWVQGSTLFLSVPTQD